MDINNKIEVKNLLAKYQIRPSKGLGQNFLVDKSALNKIITAAELTNKDTVLEIGPGLGVLTQALAQRAGQVIAIEKDNKMVEILKESLKSWNIRNVNVVYGDVLKLNTKAYGLKPKAYKIVANLPFYIVAPVIRYFLGLSEVRPHSIVLMVQKEVAQRICSRPPDMNLLAISVQFYAKPQIISYVPKTSFWPQPKVDSAIIKIEPNLIQKTHDRSFFVSNKNRDLFFKIVKAGFSQPRKQLANNLTKKLNLSRPAAEKWLLENNLKPEQRAETLTVENWINLTKTFKIN